MTDSDCPHLNTGTITEVYRIHNEADPARPYFTCCIKVRCTDCGVNFRFLGDHAGLPDDLQEAITRRLPSWTSPMGDELGMLISPMSLSAEGLEAIPAEGRA